MRKFFLPIFILIIVFNAKSFAQDTLPRISVKKISNQIIISWKNNYGAKINTINIQRSNDSLKNFITIGSVLNPLNKENGFVDRKAAGTDMFYRVFVAFDGGNYFFSPSRKPEINVPQKSVIDTSVKNVFDFTQSQKIDTLQKQVIDTTDQQAIDSPIELVNEKPKKRILNNPQKQAFAKAQKQDIVNVKKLETGIPVLETAPLPVVEKDLIPVKKFPKPVQPSGFVPSRFIYTNKDNNLILNIPDADKENFSLLFFDDKDRLVFSLKKITEPYLIVEKVNFLHTGWFYYQLYDDDILLEKYKFYIGKEGWTGSPPPETKKTKSKAK